MNNYTPSADSIPNSSICSNKMVNRKSSNRKSQHKVLLGMSGGIDSTVSAMLLLEQGYEVIGVTFRTYDSMKDSCLAKEKGCCTVESVMEAKHNAERMISIGVKVCRIARYPKRRRNYSCVYVRLVISGRR